MVAGDHTEGGGPIRGVAIGDVVTARYNRPIDAISDEHHIPQVPIDLYVLSIDSCLDMDNSSSVSSVLAVQRFDGFVDGLVVPRTVLSDNNMCIVGGFVPHSKYA